MDDRFVVGVDIGGSSVKIGLFKKDCTIVEKWSITTESLSKELLLDKISASIQEKLLCNNIDEKKLLCMGIGVPGSVDETGIVRFAPNVGWKMFDVAEEMTRRLKIPVKIANDANIAAYGELKCGSARDKASICFITLGTGVGGGIVINDRIVTGFSGCGGEIGHIIVNQDETVPCSCGRYGCLEQYVSATGIARLASGYIDKYRGDSEKQKNSKLFAYETVTSKEVFDCLKENDSIAIEIVEKFGEIMGKALANIACLFNPQIFVIGGGVSNAGDVVVQYIQKYFVQYAYSDCINTEFAIASLGNDAGIYGAASMAVAEWERENDY